LRLISLGKMSNQTNNLPYFYRLPNRFQSNSIIASHQRTINDTLNLPKQNIEFIIGKKLKISNSITQVIISNSSK
jgi:hypothetical protein